MKKELPKSDYNKDKQHSRVGKTFTLKELQDLFLNKKIKAVIS